MSAKFEPIRIVELDIDRTLPSQKASGLRLMHLKLSAHPHADWVQLFENQRRFPRHTMWRDASVSGWYIVVDCVPEELQQHLSDLKEDVTAVNAAYQTHLANVAAHEKKVAEQQAAERARLVGVKGNLNFD
jgi:hypothetical protein